MCSRTCIWTNLRTTAAALCKLQTERSLSFRAIYHLQRKLRALFTEPSSPHRDRNSPAHELLWFLWPFTEDTNGINHVQTENVEDTLVPDGKEPVHTVKEFDASGSCDNVDSDAVCVQQQSVSDMQKDTSPPSCGVEELLGMREELATLRRHLHMTLVKWSLLRQVHMYVLLPAAVRGSRQLERRRWRSLRRYKITASLRLRNYRDYVSGWDIGS